MTDDTPRWLHRLAADDDTLTRGDLVRHAREYIGGEVVDRLSPKAHRWEPDEAYGLPVWRRGEGDSDDEYRPRVDGVIRYEPTRRMLHPKLPVYGPPGIDPLDHEWDVEAMFESADDAGMAIVAVCPGGHYAQMFEAGPGGAIHAAHQPCRGAWWFVEEVMVEDRLRQPDEMPPQAVALGSPFHNGCRFCGAGHPDGTCNTGSMP